MANDQWPYLKRIDKICEKKAKQTTTTKANKQNKGRIHNVKVTLFSIQIRPNSYLPMLTVRSRKVS